MEIYSSNLSDPSPPTPPPGAYTPYAADKVHFLDF